MYHPLPSCFQSGHVPQLVGTHMINEAHSNRYARLFHTHENELELFFVYSGEGEYMVDGQSFHIKKGDMVICNAGVLHGEEPGSYRQMHSYSIALTDVMLEGLPANWLCAKTVSPVVSCGMLGEEIGHAIKLIYLLFSHQRNLEYASRYMAVSLLLLTHDLLSSRADKEARKSKRESDMLARHIQAYIDEHYHENLSLRAIGKALHMNEYHLAHIFSREIGIPPMQYVLKRRIGEAQSLLMDTLLPVAEIAVRLGYENPANFSVAFSKYVGLSPSKYRQSFQTMRQSHDKSVEGAAPAANVKG